VHDTELSWVAIFDPRGAGVETAVHLVPFQCSLAGTSPPSEPVPTARQSFLAGQAIPSNATRLLLKVYSLHPVPFQWAAYGTTPEPKPVAQQSKRPAQDTASGAVSAVGGGLSFQLEPFQAAAMPWLRSDPTARQPLAVQHDTAEKPESFPGFGLRTTFQEVPCHTAA